LRIFSFGGGQQSVAVLVLAAQNKVQYDAFVFANVGDDSEEPRTLHYLNEYAKPFAAAYGLELIEVARKGKTLYQDLVGDNRSINIPVYMANGAPGNRNCTVHYKVKVVARWTKQRGATVDNPATIGLGISLDEMGRMNESRIAHQRHEYPLVDLRMTRQDCINVITQAGLPVPPKSACWWCPFKRHSQWQQLRNEQPDLFDRAVSLEQRINEKRVSLNRDRVYLHRALQPLDQAVGQQYNLFEDDACESGYCMT
jgi:hypothetical protein